MADAVSTQPKPYLVALQSGRAYLWCACGRSRRQPFCDGSHEGTGLTPRRFVAPRTEEVLLCGCKRTGDAPFCDGTHTNLPGGSPLDDPDSPANRAIPLVTETDGPRRWLDGGCYVVTPDAAPAARQGALCHRRIVGSEFGARCQSQFMLEAEDETPPVSFGASEAILFVMSGRGALEIAGRRFPIDATDGAYVRPGETLRLAPAGGERLRVFALASPPAAALEWPGGHSEAFDEAHPRRVVTVDAAQRTAMGPRYFQILVDKRVGSRVVTQFIGHIPRSKAAPHRHLYEETIIVLSGRGCMWTETRKASVGPGEVIFLPRKQLHSLEATADDGLFVVGVICPGDNPSINYYD